MVHLKISLGVTNQTIKCSFNMLSLNGKNVFAQKFHYTVFMMQKPTKAVN